MVASDAVSSDLRIPYSRKGFGKAFVSYLRAVRNGQESSLLSSAVRSNPSWMSRAPSLGMEKDQFTISENRYFRQYLR